MIQLPETVKRQWAEQLIRLIRQGGTWGWPEQCMVYQFDHANRTLTRLLGEDGDPHDYVRECFALCGWEVKP